MQQPKTLQHLIETLGKCVQDGYAQREAHNPEFIHLFAHTLGLDAERIVEIAHGCNSMEEVAYVDLILCNGDRACIYFAETERAKSTAKKLGVSDEYFVYIDDLADDGMLNGEPSPMSMVYKCETQGEAYAEFHHFLLNHLV